MCYTVSMAYESFLVNTKIKDLEFKTQSRQHNMKVQGILNDIQENEIYEVQHSISREGHEGETIFSTLIIARIYE